MSVSFNEASTLQAATSHQCSRDADGDGEGGRNGYPSDSVEAALIRDKYDVVSSENHDQMAGETSGSEETPCTSSDTDGEGAGATMTNQRVSYAFTSSPFSFHARHILPTSKFHHNYSCILLIFYRHRGTTGMRTVSVSVNTVHWFDASSLGNTCK